MPDISNEASQIIIDTLIEHGILPESARQECVTDDYELGYLISSQTTLPCFTLRMENYGTDGDAGEDYEALLQRFAKRSEGKMQFDDLTSITDGDKVTLSFTFNSKPYRWEFEQYSDHLNAEFMDYFTALQKDSPAGCFLLLDGGDFPEYCLVPPAVYRTLLEQGAINEDDW